MNSITNDSKMRLLVNGSPALPVTASFRYERLDPYAVRVTFFAVGEATEWIMARDLLAAGMRHDAGLCDVRIWPNSDLSVIYINLSSPEGEALLEAPAPELQAFLDAAYRLVPAGDESGFCESEIDSVLREIVEEGL